MLFDTTIHNLSYEEPTNNYQDGLDDADWLMSAFFKDNPNIQIRSVAPPDADRMSQILDYARLERIVPREWDVAWLKRYAAALRGHQAAALQYIPRRYQGRVTLFKPSDRAAETKNGSHSYGLEKIATEGVEMHIVPGSHSTMLHGDGAREISRRLLQILNS